MASYLLDKISDDFIFSESNIFSLLTSGSESTTTAEPNFPRTHIPTVMVQEIQGKDGYACKCIVCEPIDLEIEEEARQSLVRQIKEDLVEEVTKKIAGEERQKGWEAG